MISRPCLRSSAKPGGTHIVVMHDDRVDRTTNGSGRVDQMTLAELKALDAGSYLDPKFAAMQVPTYEEALEALRGSGVRLVLDIKRDDRDIDPDHPAEDMRELVRLGVDGIITNLPELCRSVITECRYRRQRRIQLEDPHTRGFGRFTFGSRSVLAADRPSVGLPTHVRSGITCATTPPPSAGGRRPDLLQCPVSYLEAGPFRPPSSAGVRHDREQTVGGRDSRGWATCPGRGGR
jgi:Glycerophosphoryl diester phosphodiesterase family